MGQFALGIRSLLVKASIFVVMAALLAWALGGTLWPRPARVEIYALNFSGHDLYWLLEVRDGLVAETTAFPEEHVRWKLLTRNSKGRSLALPYSAIDPWCDVAGPKKHENMLYFGGLVFNPSGGQWFLYTIGADGTHHRAAMPDRLAVEQQLARLKAGLPLQDQQTILQQRAAMLDPGPKTAEMDGTTDEQ